MDQHTVSRVDLIWNKGIAALCDVRIPDEFPDGKTYSFVPSYARPRWFSRLPDNLISNPSACAKIGEGSLVWVRLTWLKSFVRQVLPLVKANFVLVTGDSSRCVPSQVRAEAHKLFECSKVIHWFTQDYDGSAPSKRISPIPLGIDFHSISEKAHWGEEMTSPLEQERTLVSIGKNLPPLQARQLRIYADFGWQGGVGLYRRLCPLEGARLRENRRQLAKKLRSNDLVHFQAGPLGRSEMWRRRGEFAFVLSPHGWGLDCHRTWEALALGHIVLVPSSSLDSLYSGLPVIALKSWSEITPENLEIWLSMYPSGGANCEKLKIAYWIDKMRSRAQG
jgi:hypothetical protein